MPSGMSVLNNIKSKLGLETAAADDYIEEDLEYDEYDEYEDAEDEGYTTRRGSDRSSRSTRGSSSLPRLVSVDDARESARYSSTSRDASSRRSTAVRSYGRDMVDSSLPPAMTPEGSAAVSAASNRRSEGLDSLFSSTAASTSDKDTIAEPSLPIMDKPASTSNASLGVTSINLPGKRQLQVIRPTKYDDVENVTKVLKVSDVAILTLSAVPSDLMKRMLDFSFGAASALDASVEAIGNKVFAITRGVPLSDAERADLQAMGVI